MLKCKHYDFYEVKKGCNYPNKNTVFKFKEHHLKLKPDSIHTHENKQENIVFL